MTLTITFPDSGSPITVANLTDLMGGIAPTSTSISLGYVFAEWAGLPDLVDDFAGHVLGLYQAEQNLSVKFQIGNAP